MFSLQHLWTRTSAFTVLLAPVATLFVAAAWLRRQLYRRGALKTFAVPVPVIIVGNITAGGSGKTPLVIWLVNRLRELGYRPGVVSRGYGGRAQGSVAVGRDSSPGQVGDEPLLIHVKTAAPVVVDRDRVAAARALLTAHPEVDVIVADDGLQHYRLKRDIEIAVLDSAAGIGNGWPIPAGPLREPASRLDSVDAVVQVVRGAALPRAYPSLKTWRVDYQIGEAWPLNAPHEKKALAQLPQDGWVAATGIGRPQGFFDMLAARRIGFDPLAFPDHHAFRQDDLPATGRVLMTEKDAVKCLRFAGPDWWAVELEVTPEPGFVDWLVARLEKQKARTGAPKKGWDGTQTF
jgi:tetraacyldisaccharide 4'-kinase